MFCFSELAVIECASTSIIKYERVMIGEQSTIVVNCYYIVRH